MLWGGLIRSCSAREGRAVAGMFASSRPLGNLSSQQAVWARDLLPVNQPEA